MSKETTPLPPKHLKPLTRQWWSSVLTDYELEPHHIRLLTLAGEAWDRCCAARAVVDKSGMTYTDRFGDPRPRPEIAIERDARTSFARLLRELDLDVGTPAANSRPPLLKSNRRGSFGIA
jgi:phage terminase small subunit